MSASASGKSTLERAFELARSGEATTLTDILRLLKAEGRWDARAQLDGHYIRRQVNALLKACGRAEA